jgi:hypothetical protein
VGAHVGRVFAPARLLVYHDEDGGEFAEEGEHGGDGGIADQVDAVDYGVQMAAEVFVQTLTLEGQAAFED